MSLLPGILYLSNISSAPAGDFVAGAHPIEFVVKNLHVIGTKVGSMRDTNAALDLAARVSIDAIPEKFSDNY